ncbi:MAG: response regulator [Geminicoccaceae bacterium]
MNQSDERHAPPDDALELALDRITRLASALFDVSIATIAVPVENRFEFKSVVGLDVTECPENTDIHSLAIDGNQLSVLEDASADQRFQNHPMVTSAPHIRFHASVPLVTPDGQRIGTLNIADNKPRQGFPTADADRLQELAALAVDEFELRSELRKAIRAQEANSAVLASMSHEIRTPMNGVLGMAELLLTAEDLNERHRRRIEVIKRSGETLLSLIDQFLDFSKLQASEIKLKASPFDLRKLINSIRDEFEAKAHGRTLPFAIVDQLGNYHRVVGDPLFFKKLILSFLDTVTRKSAERNILIEAKALPAAIGNVRFHFEMKDDGIDAKAIKRLLVPFEQDAHLSPNALEEANIGLAICKKLALMMGGNIGVDNLSSEISTFWLRVDLKAETAIIAPEFSPDPPVAFGQSGLASTTRDVLVAEDNPDMALLIEDLLEEAGYRATIAPDGASVLKILGEQHFDVVLMDGRMPGMNGFETTDRIRQLPDECSNIPIIALTGEALAGDRERYLSAGMDDYVAKPVDYKKLIRAIERCCRQRKYSTPTEINAATIL